MTHDPLARTSNAAPPPLFARPATSTSEANSVAEALRLLQEAQNDVATACRALCSIDNVDGAYRDVCRLHDEVKRVWHVVDEKTARVRAEGGGR